MTDEVLEVIMWETARPWEERWETLKVNESRVEEQEVDDENKQARFWRRRPDGFSVNERENVSYILEFKRVSDTGDQYVSETQKLTGIQHLDVTQGLKKLFKDTQWTLYIYILVHVSICLQYILPYSSVLHMYSTSLDRIFAIYSSNTF